MKRKKSLDKNICNGIFGTGKCVLSRIEGKEFNLNIKSKRVICINSVNEHGECNMILGSSLRGKY